MAKGNSGTDGRTERLFPLRFLATLVGGIGLAEVISMLVIYFVKQDTPYSLQTLVDTGIMIILIFPLLYSLSFRPLMGQIEQRKQNEARLQRVNRALRLLNHCNQVLVHAEDETRLLDKMCEILISTGGYRMAWVGFTEQSPAKKVWPVAQGGFDAGYLDLSQTAWTDTERDQEPTITAIRTGVIQVNQDFLPSPQMAPWREAALQRDYRSCIALPLKEGKTVFGVLTIYSGLPGAFNSEEVDLLEELANDLAYGIQALREQIERKQADEFLRTANIYNRSLIEASLDPQVTITSKGKIGDVNAATEKATGLSRQELAGTDFCDYFSDQEKARAGYQRVFKTGSVRDYELEIRHKDGSLMPVLYNASAFHDEQGAVVGVFATARDITARKQAENELANYRQHLEELVKERTAQLEAANTRLRSEVATRRRAEKALIKEHANLQNIFDAVNVGMMLIDQDGRTQRVNNVVAGWTGKEVEKMHGLQPGDVLGCVHALEGPGPCGQTPHCQACRVRNTFESVLQSGQPVHDVEVQTTLSLRGKRKHLWLDLSADPLEVNGRRHTILALSNITPLKEAQEALRKAHDELELRVEERTRELELERTRLRKIMDVMPDNVFMINAEYEVEYANPTTLKEFGPVAGQACYAYFHGLAEPCSWCKNEDVLSGNTVLWEHHYAKTNKTYEVFATPFIDWGGDISKLKILHDITDRKLAEQTLEKRNIELQAVSSAEHAQRQFSEALAEAAFTLAQSLRVEEVLMLILQQIKGVIPYQFADITLLEGESFHEIGCPGKWKQAELDEQFEQRFPVQNFAPLSKSVQSSRPLLIADTHQEPAWASLKDWQWARSFLSAPLLVEKKVIGFVNLFADQPGFFTQKMSLRLGAFAAHAAAAIQNAWLFEQVRASNDRLQSLSRRLVDAQENERLYISRELHDEAGQALTSLVVDLELLEKRSSQPEEVLKLASQMEDSLNEVIENLHRVAMSLRPASLDHIGLVGALRQYVETIGEKHGLQVSFSANGLEERLPGNVETVLYRIVQEALTNVVRHAQARHVDIVLTVRDDKLVVIVEDDGAGFDPEAVSGGDHLGLFGMRERAEMVGGQLVVESAPGTGTTIMVEVDYDNQVADR